MQWGFAHASFGNLYLRDGEFFRLVALHNTPSALAWLQRRGQPYRPARMRHPTGCYARAGWFMLLTSR